MAALLALAFFCAIAPATASDVARGDSFTSFIRAQAVAGSDSLVPGGMMKNFFNTAGSFGVHADTNTQRFHNFTLEVLSTGRNPVNFIDTIQLYYDADTNEVYSAPDVLMANMSFISSSVDTSQYQANNLQKLLTNASRSETYVLVVRTKHISTAGLRDTTLTDTHFALYIPVQGVQIQDVTDSVITPKRTALRVTFETFAFNVYRDSINTTPAGDLVSDTIHFDSRALTATYSIFRGSFFGETRTVGGDTLSRIGVRFYGNSNFDVDTAFVLLGASAARIDLVKTTGIGWQATNINRAVSINGTAETFIIKVGFESAPSAGGPSIGALIDADSFQTQLHAATLGTTSFGTLFNLAKPKLDIETYPVGNKTIHPDSRTGQMPITVLSGRIKPTGESIPARISNDTIVYFAVGFDSIINGTSLSLIDYESVALRVRQRDGTDTTARMRHLTNFVGGVNDTIFVLDNVNIPIDTAAHFDVLLWAHPTAVNDSFIVKVLKDSFATIFRDTGPAVPFGDTAIIKFSQPRVRVDTIGLTSKTIHPDSRVGLQPAVMLHGRIMPETGSGSDTLAYDTITSFAISFGDSIQQTTLLPTDIESVTLKIRLRNGTDSFVRLTPVGNPANFDTRFQMMAPAEIPIGESAYFTVMVGVHPTANGKVAQAQVLGDSVFTAFRSRGPITYAGETAVFTFTPPRTDVETFAISSRNVHADSRALQMGFVVCSGSIKSAGNGTESVAYDTVTSFAVALADTFGTNSTLSQFDAFGSLDGNDVESVALRIRLRNGTDTVMALHQRLFMGFANDSIWQLATASIPIADSARFSVLVWLHPTSSGDSLRARVLPDSVTSTFRTAGPVTPAGENAVFTMLVPRAAVDTNHALTSLVSHPDSRLNGNGGIIVCSGTIRSAGATAFLTDTLVYDTLTSFAVALTDTFGTNAGAGNQPLAFGSLDGIDVESVALRITMRTGVDTIMALSQRVFAGAGSDSIWHLAAGSNIPIADSAKFSVIVWVHPTANGDSLICRVLPDSVQSVLRTPGPVTPVGETAVFTYFISRVAVDTFSLASRQVHYDSRVGQLPAIVCSGIIRAAGANVGFTRESVTYDTVTAFAIAIGDTMAASFTAFGTIDPGDVESVALQIRQRDGTDSVVQLSKATSAGGLVDTIWHLASPANIPIGDSARFSIRIGVRTEARNDSIICRVLPDSVQTAFRTPGPVTPAGETAVFTFAAPRVHISDSWQVKTNSVIGFIRDTVVHPDSRLGFMPVTTMIAHIAQAGNYTTDTLTYDTLTGFAVRFYVAGDSIDPGDVESIAVRVRMRTGGDTVFQLSRQAGFQDSVFTAATPLNIPIGDSAEFRILLGVHPTADRDSVITAVINDSTFTVFRETGPVSLAADTAIIYFEKPHLKLAMTQIADTIIPPWTVFGQNPVVVCSGTIYGLGTTNPYVPYDTLTRFGVKIDSSIGRSGSRADSFVRVTLRLFRASGTHDTILYVNSDDSRLWRLTGDTNINDTQAFQVLLQFTSESTLIWDTVAVSVHRDSVASVFRFGSVDSAVDTHSGAPASQGSDKGRNIFFSYNVGDSTSTRIDALGDTIINPDSRFGQNPFMMAKGRIQGSRSFITTSATHDSLTRFAVVLHSNFSSGLEADSVDSVVLYIGLWETAVVLYSDTVQRNLDAFGKSIRVWERGAQDDTISFYHPFTGHLVGDTNADTFILRCYAKEAMGNDSRLTGYINADSITTTYTDDSTTNQQLALRVITFFKNNYVIDMTTLTDTTASPFKIQLDSILVASGKFSSVNVPTDSVEWLSVKIRHSYGSGIFRSDSIQSVTMQFAAGLVNPAFETTLVLDSASPQPRYRTAGKFTVDSGQTFTIRVKLYDTNAAVLDGETMTAEIESTFARFSVGTQSNLTSGRTIGIAYQDTVVIRDSVLANITLHPDTRRQQNPFLLWAGHLRGNISTAGLQDTLQLIGFRFTGTAADSVASCTVVFGPNYPPGSTNSETLVLTKVGTETNAWRAFVDSRVLAADSVFVRLLVQMPETTVLGTRLSVNIDADSVRFYYSRETSAFTASRTVLIDKDTTFIHLYDIADTSISMFRAQDDSIVVCSGTITTSITGDSLYRFGVQILDRAGNGFESTTAVSLRLFGVGNPVPLSVNHADSRFWTVSLDSAISTTQRFDVLVQWFDTEIVKGETFTVSILRDSVQTAFQRSNPVDTNSNRIVKFWYRDTLVITSFPLTAFPTTIHPDSRQSQNPFTAWAGKIRGQQSTLNLADTLQRLGVGISGTIVGTSGDSIHRMYLLFSTGDSITFTKSTGSDTTWTVSFQDTPGLRTFPTRSAAADTAELQCTILVRVYDSVAVGNNGVTLIVNLLQDSVQSFFCADTTRVTGNTYLIDKDRLRIDIDTRDANYASTRMVGTTDEYFAFQMRSPIRGDSIAYMTISIYGEPRTKSGFGNGDIGFAFDTVLLVREQLINQNFDTGYPADTVVGYFTRVAAETWAYSRETTAYTVSQFDLRIDTTTTNDSAHFLIVLRVPDTATAAIDSQIRVTIGPNAVIPVLAKFAPTSDLNFDSYKIIPKDTVPPIPPQVFTITSLTGSLVLYWEPSPSGDTQMSGGLYNVFYDSAQGTAIPDTLLQAVAHVSGQQSYSLTLTNTTLTADSTYRFRLTAQDSSGNQGVSSLIVSATFRSATTTLPVDYASVALVSPVSGDVQMRTTTMELTAKVNSGASSIDSVIFEARPLSGGGAYTVIGTTSVTYSDGNNNSYYTLSFDSSNPAVAFTDSYEFRAVAVVNGARDTYATTTSATLTNNSQVATTLSISDSDGATSTAQFFLAPDLQTVLDTATITAGADSRLATDVTLKVDQISTRTSAPTITAVTPTTSQRVAVTMGRGALNNDTDKMTLLVQRGGFSESVVAALQALGVQQPMYWVNLTLQSGQSVLSTTTESTTITFSYTDNNQDDIDDSTGQDITKLKCFTTSGSGRSGRTLQLTEVIGLDRALRRITARVTHFSPFFLAIDTGNNMVGLNRLIVGPNPYRPTDPGFAAAGVRSGIYFRNMPPNWKIEIYTILGERVTELSSATSQAGGGTVGWDVRNTAGTLVSSGYYLYIVTDETTKQRVTGKIAIIR